ncbi:hypothetical protein CDAR_462071 [Caerostris darwini]|uniref:Uncharacterized protein n=1 Tax=Caerostris darwini TaxID=1538125 RepID=A0AAV4QR65_9ARAC|nr:hypothetical protein CDAR_462071 [Caerostris darwini]
MSQSLYPILKHCTSKHALSPEAKINVLNMFCLDKNSFRMNKYSKKIRLSFYEAKDKDRGRGHQQMQCSEILRNKLAMMAEMLCWDLVWFSGQVN